ncbi:hypothetical protein CEXT_567531 [Caerostris extrusa]|uniref:Uncharacterized protein n=1 Tax=Caerostris extrusa TaxID=172846 RepID=A0AAV4NBD6_CAEEX|nr:hypothetical protein CEXT_567531 [Caerostris extrusa]
MNNGSAIEKDEKVLSFGPTKGIEKERYHQSKGSRSLIADRLSELIEYMHCTTGITRHAMESTANQLGRLVCIGGASVAVIVMWHLQFRCSIGIAATHCSSFAQCVVV